MRKLIIAVLLGFSMMATAQNYNPFVAQGIVAPAPLYNVASNGTGVVSFLVGNSGDDPMPLVTNQEMLLVITLSRGIPDNADPIAAISGSMKSYFNWMYDPSTKSYLGTQNKDIPGALTGGTGDISIAYKVVSNSVETSPQNGFNVNVTPPAYTNGINSLNDDQVSSYTWTIDKPNVTNPDLNVTYVGVPVSGNLNTNDNVVTGTTYGSPLPQTGNPSTAVPMIGADGSYTFSTTIPGEYSFLVPVCPPAQTTNCPLEILTITVLDTVAGVVNPPTANPDNATTITGVSVSINVLSNDKCNNSATCTLTNPTITTTPKHGTTTVDPITGNIIYVPTTGFVGIDTLKYAVCDNEMPIAKCDTEYVFINVLPTTSPNTTTASDDYSTTDFKTPVSSNALSNDIDPEGQTQKVTAQSITRTGIGTFTIDTLGNYTFTPDTAFAGPVNFVYTVCDNAIPSACAEATIYITVNSMKINNPLPVDLFEFNAVWSKNDASLNWSTSREENSLKFEIERSIDGKEFSKVGEVKAAGNSLKTINYNYLDVNAKLLKTSLVYYRINSIDIDGKSNKSNIKTLAINNNTEISIYPNPANNVINISNSDLVWKMDIIDMLGQKVKSIDFSALSKVINQVDISEISNGIYNVEIIDFDNVHHLIKLNVQR